MTNAQLPLFPLPRLNGRVVNVASVPQRSVFRYPGGKTWLVPYIRQWLASLSIRPAEFVEPFAGGGIVGLTVAFEQLAQKVTLLELDDQVAAVWQIILSEHGPELADRIVKFKFTTATVEQTLAQPAKKLLDKAFQTILRNRVNRGGILASGAGRVKHGESGKGLQSRWYPLTLKKRILDIVAIRERIHFIHGDGLKSLKQNATRPNSVFFIDSPYTAGGKRAGSRLYTHADLDHPELFRVASGLKGDFFMTYDDAPEVRALANQHGFDTHLIPMKNTHHAEMKELLIGQGKLKQ